MSSSMFCFTGSKMKQKELYKTSIYCRLSLDDGSEGDSSSIHTQKMLLEKYGWLYSIKDCIESW